MFLITAWFVLALVVGGAATARGRNGLGWFVLSLIASPLIAILLLIAMPSLYWVDANGVQRRVVTERQSQLSDNPVTAKELLIAGMAIGAIVFAVSLANFLMSDQMTAQSVTVTGQPK